MYQHKPKRGFFVHERHWLPSLTCADHALTLQHSVLVIAPLRKTRMTKLKIMCTFPLDICGTPIEIGGIDLDSLEIASGVQVINHLVSLFTKKTHSKMLMATKI